MHNRDKNIQLSYCYQTLVLPLNDNKILCVTFMKRDYFRCSVAIHVKYDLFSLDIIFLKKSNRPTEVLLGEGEAILLAHPLFSPLRL